jgi:predicted nucleic acid-binding protein
MSRSSSVAVGAQGRALLCDTRALLDYLVAASPDHKAFHRAIDLARTRYVPGLVLAEVDYFLREEREAMAALIHDLAW